MQQPAPDAGKAAESAAARIAPQYTILGVRLLPLSVGRFQTLRSLSSPFASDESTDATIEDLFVAVAVCGLTCAEWRERLAKGTLHRPLRRWGKRLARQIRKEKDFTAHSRAGMLACYVRDSLKMPYVPLPVQQSSDWATSRHWSESLASVLKSRLGWSKANVDEDPISEALSEYWGLMEAEGHAKLVPQELVEEMERIGRENAEVLERIQNAGKESNGTQP